jgi:hypothetical protein
MGRVSSVKIDARRVALQIYFGGFGSSARKSHAAEKPKKLGKLIHKDRFLFAK